MDHSHTETSKDGDNTYMANVYVCSRIQKKILDETHFWENPKIEREKMSNLYMQVQEHQKKRTKMPRWNPLLGTP